MGALFAYLASEAGSAIKRRATIYGLMAAGGLIAIFAAGYALNALYAFLSFRWGPIAASLSVAGGLLVLAVASVVAARMVAQQRSRDPVQLVNEATHRAFRRSPVSRQQATALAAGAAGALVAAATAAVVARWKGMRLSFGRKPGRSR